MITPSSTGMNRMMIPFLVFITLLTGSAAISSQSFWMDEGGPAFKALMPTLKDWWFMTMRLGGSDTQMPLYMFLLWVWEKMLGNSEFTLRAINLPWLILTVLILKRVRYWPLVCLTSPFVLYYTGELRPYAMQITAGAMAAYALIRVSNAVKNCETVGLHVTAGASLLLASSSLTGAVWALGLWVGVLVIMPGWLKQKGFWLRITPWMLAAFVMAGYYLFTLLQGYRAAGIEGSSILSVLFGFYEMVGLLGCGPSKNELRDSLHSLIPFLPWLVPAFLITAAAWCCGTLTWLKQTPNRIIIGVACAVLLPIIILSITGIAMNFRVLGRHLSPAIPAVLLPLALTLEGKCAWHRSGQILAGLAVIFSLSSAITLRFHPRHARDDFRQASTMALDALRKRQNIWWQADMNCMRYYAYLEGGIPLVNAVQVLESNPPSSLLIADGIILNRPDLKYPNTDYQKEFTRNSFKLDKKFTGFEVWKSDFK